MKNFTLLLAIWLCLLVGCSASNGQDTTAADSGRTKSPTSVKLMPNAADFYTEEYDLEALADAVNDAVAKTNDAVITGDPLADAANFHSLMQDLDAAESQIDLMEDILAAHLQSGALTHTDYLDLGTQLEALENKLEVAEERLETLFGIDD